MLLGVIAVEVATRSTSAAPVVTTARHPATPAPAVPALAAPEEPALDWPRTRPVRLLFIGDSLSYGFYATSRARSFPELVARKLGSQVTVTVDARSGVTASYWMHTSFPATNIAVLELGTNDYRKTPLTEFTSDYRSLIASVRRTSPHAQFLCLAIWHSANDAVAVSYDQAIQQVCPGVYVELGQLYDYIGMRGTPGLATWVGKSDDWHPGNAGHAAIANRVISALGVPR